MVKIEFATDNAAFGYDYEEKWERKFYKAQEIKHVLQNVANQIENGAESGYCMDINGNRIGKWEVR